MESETDRLERYAFELFKRLWATNAPTSSALTVKKCIDAAKIFITMIDETKR
jgi:hypothetical protein